jgi:hypothetical protein
MIRGGRLGIWVLIQTGRRSPSAASSEDFFHQIEVFGGVSFLVAVLNQLTKLPRRELPEHLLHRIAGRVHG